MFRARLTQNKFCCSAQQLAEVNMDLDFLESMVGEVVEESPYRNIWVVVEKEGDALTPVALEMLGKVTEVGGN